MAVAGPMVAGLEVAVLETPLVKAALSKIMVKTDRNDARSLEQHMRMSATGGGRTIPVSMPTVSYAPIATIHLIRWFDPIRESIEGRLKSAVE